MIKYHKHQYITKRKLCVINRRQSPFLHPQPLNASLWRQPWITPTFVQHGPGLKSFTFWISQMFRLLPKRLATASICRCPRRIGHFQLWKNTDWRGWLLVGAMSPGGFNLHRIQHSTVRHVDSASISSTHKPYTQTPMRWPHITVAKNDAHQR